MDAKGLADELELDHTRHGLASAGRHARDDQRDRHWLAAVRTPATLALSNVARSPNLRLLQRHTTRRPRGIQGSRLRRREGIRRFARMRLATRFPGRALRSFIPKRAELRGCQVFR